MQFYPSPLARSCSDTSGNSQSIVALSETTTGDLNDANEQLLENRYRC